MLVWHELRPLQAMAAALFFKHRRLMLVLPRQYGGKTELGCRLDIDFISRSRTQSALFLAKDHRSAKKATREKFRRLCDPKKFAVNTEQIYLKSNPSSVLEMGSVDKEPDRQRGGTYGLMHWTEVAFSKIEKGETITGVFNKIIKPTLSLRDGYVLMETTLNGGNDFKSLWEDYKAHRFARLIISFSQMMEMGLVSRETYEYEKGQYHPDVFSQEFECEFVSFKGKAYPELSARHIDYDMPWPESWQTVCWAIDWGFHPSATCVLFGYVKDKVLNVFDEHWAYREMPIVTGQEIDKRKRSLSIDRMHGVADHDLARNEELTSRGIDCALADKTNVFGARMQIKEALYFDKIRIHPRCVHLLADLHAATWNPKHEGELDDTQWSEGHGDGEAALRYLIRMFSGVESEKPEDDAMDAFDTASATAHRLYSDNG